MAKERIHKGESGQGEARGDENEADHVASCRRLSCSVAWLRKTLDGAIANHSAIGVRNHDHVAALGGLGGYGIAGHIQIIFEGRGGVPGGRGKGHGDTFQLMLFLKGLDDLVVACRSMPGTRYEDEGWWIGHVGSEVQLIRADFGQQA